MTFNALRVAQTRELATTGGEVVDEEPFLAGGVGNLAASNAPGAAAVCMRNVVEVDQ